MTSIVVWAGVDSRAAASLYIASDSRISWGRGEAWDRGRKTFASQTQPYIFGYWGDVAFPALALPLVVDMVDTGLIAARPHRPFGEIGSALQRLWREYPNARRGDGGIVVGYRSGSGMRSQFALALFEYFAGVDEWSFRRIPAPKVSGRLTVVGSGADQIRTKQRLWDASAQGRTSRAVFGAFCEALALGGDPKTGGAPQLVGLNRIGTGTQFGVVFSGKRHFAGAVVGEVEAKRADTVEWFNHLFERVDGVTMKLLDGAQRHLPRS